MALLLDIRRLDPFRLPGHMTESESATNLTAAAERVCPEPASFGNPTFEGDLQAGKPWSPTSQSTTIPIADEINTPHHLTTTVNLNNNNISDSSLPTSDSGIHITAPSIDSTPSRKSFDSGLYEVATGDGNRGKAPFVAPPDGSLDNSLSSKDHEESLMAICVQVFIPFLIAGVGTCGAGIVLGDVEEWEVFKNVTELFILVPTLLGLKGNLEMTLASRVSTQANLGKLDTLSEQWQMSWGNMALIQCQATVMSFLAAIFATAMSYINGGFSVENALLLGASSLFTAATASLALGAITLAVVVVAHKYNINPDNVATPIAASLGDVTTLGLLAAISSFLYQMKGNFLCSTLIVCVFLVLVPGWAYLSYRNPYVRQVLYTGWLPVILAVIITSAGGYILEFSVTQFKGIAVFQPVINGVAGNLVAVQASRISTYFHRSCKPGDFPPDGSSVCISPFSAFCGKSPHARTARLLLAMVIPGHLLFGYGITLIKGGDTALTPTFLPIYLSSAFIQITLLLYIAQCLIQILWRWKIDPDNSAIPLLTALGDLSGMACLTIAFYIHAAVAETP